MKIFVILRMFLVIGEKVGRYMKFENTIMNFRNLSWENGAYYILSGIIH